MSTQMDNPVDAANATADALKQQTNPGDVASVARDEIKSAHESFAGKPQDYRAYISSLKGSLSQGNQPEWLHDVEIFDSAATANDTIGGKTGANGTPVTRADDSAQVKALTGSPDNKDELYKLLDNYSATKNSDTSDAARGDGKIGRGDLQAFIDDAQSGQDNPALQYMAKHPEAAPAIQQMNDRLGGAPGFIVRDELLHEMGYSGNDAQTTFQNENPELGAVVTVGGNGKPDSLIIPDGTSRGFHYNENGTIDGINKTNPDGSTKQYRKDGQGLWVDENGNPAGFAKPSFDADGNYQYYTPDANDPNKVVQTSIDAKTGGTTSTAIDVMDAAGNLNPALAELAEPLGPENSAPVDIAAGASGKLGRLDVVGAEGGAEYTINDGDNLTEISRRILNMQPGQEDPTRLEAVVNALAAANKYDDPNLILTGAQMKVPAEIMSAAKSAQPGSDQLGPEQQALGPEPALTPQPGLPVSEDPSLSALPTELPTADGNQGPLAVPGQTWKDLVMPPAIYGQSADSALKA
ncbi:hypothetical protein BH10CYA1_BH10CYA1_34730 [soil metagenome]